MMAYQQRSQGSKVPSTEQFGFGYGLAPLTSEVQSLSNIRTGPVQASKSLFVGDLSFFCTELELASAFSGFGPIESLEIKRGRHGDSLMHGFVEFASDADANRAIQEMHGKKFMGRKIRVNWTNQKVPAAPDSDSWVQVHVNFLSPNIQRKITEEFLESVFIPFGSIADVTVKRHLCSFEPKQVTGYAFVYFTDVYAALRAIYALRSVPVDAVFFECCLSYKAEQMLKDYNGMTAVIKRQQTPNPSAFFKRFEKLQSPPSATSAAIAAASAGRPQGPQDHPTKPHMSMYHQQQQQHQHFQQPQQQSRVPSPPLSQQQQHHMLLQHQQQQQQMGNPFSHWPHNTQQQQPSSSAPQLHQQFQFRTPSDDLSHTMHSHSHTRGVMQMPSSMGMQIPHINTASSSLSSHDLLVTNTNNNNTSVFQWDNGSTSSTSSHSTPKHYLGSVAGTASTSASTVAEQHLLGRDSSDLGSVVGDDPFAVDLFTANNASSSTTMSAAQLKLLSEEQRVFLEYQHHRGLLMKQQQQQQQHQMPTW